MIHTETTLSSLALNEYGTLIRISPGLSFAHRLLDFGFLPGTKIQCILLDSRGETAAYRIRGTTIVLRKEDAKHIVIQHHRPGGQS